MAILLTLIRRELAGYFLSLRGYVIMTGVQMMLGASLLMVVHSLNQRAFNLPLTEVFPQSEYFWMVLLLITPIITMRTFAHEKFTGTFETLMTTPVQDFQVVLAKFVGAYIFYLIAFLPMLTYPFILKHFAHQPMQLEWRAVLSLGGGVALFGAFFISLGCFASSLTRSQIVAAVATFAIGTGHLLLSYLSDLRPPEMKWWFLLYQHISLLEHMKDFASGILDTRHIIFYLSLTGVFLFLTFQSIESRRWK